MDQLVKYQNVVDSLTTKIVELTENIFVGDLNTHRTDLQMSDVYVVTDFVYNLGDDNSKEGIYVVASRSAKGVHQDGIVFKLMEIQKVETD